MQENQTGVHARLPFSHNHRDSRANQSDVPDSLGVADAGREGACVIECAVAAVSRHEDPRRVRQRRRAWVGVRDRAVHARARRAGRGRELQQRWRLGGAASRREPRAPAGLAPRATKHLEGISHRHGGVALEPERHGQAVGGGGPPPVRGGPAAARRRGGGARGGRPTVHTNQPEPVQPLQRLARPHLDARPQLAFEKVCAQLLRFRRSDAAAAAAAAAATAAAATAAAASLAGPPARAPPAGAPLGAE